MGLILQKTQYQYYVWTWNESYTGANGRGTYRSCIPGLLCSSPHSIKPMPKAYSKFEVDDAKTLIKPSQQHFILLQNYQTNNPFLYFLFFHSHYFSSFTHHGNVHMNDIHMKDVNTKNVSFNTNHRQSHFVILQTNNQYPFFFFFFSFNYHRFAKGKFKNQCLTLII